MTSDNRPGVTLTRDQLEAWAGRTLTDDEVDRLDDAIPNSGLPETVAIICDSFEPIDDDQDDEHPAPAPAADFSPPAATPMLWRAEHGRAYYLNAGGLLTYVPMLGTGLDFTAAHIIDPAALPAAEAQEPQQIWPLLLDALNARPELGTITVTGGHRFDDEAMPATTAPLLWRPDQGCAYYLDEPGNLICMYLITGSVLSFADQVVCAPHLCDLDVAEAQGEAEAFLKTATADLGADSPQQP